MRIVFFGTPEYVIPILDTLHKTFRRRNESPPIVAVVTQPPKPVGRKGDVEFSAVDDWAFKKRIPKYFDPMDLLDNDVEADLGVSASFGQIVKKSVIDHFEHGILNVHFSLLPHFRGAGPVQATIATNGQAGVTILKMDDQLDHGPIVSQFKDELLESDTTESLRNRLFVRSAKVLAGLIPAYVAGKVNIKAQDHAKATYTKLIRKEDGFVEWEYLKACQKGRAFLHKGLTLANEMWEIPFIKGYEQEVTPVSVERYIRAMHPWPGTWTLVKIGKKEKRLKILKAHLEKSDLLPTTYCLQLDKVQLEGKNSVSWKQFAEAYGFA